MRAPRNPSFNPDDDIQKQKSIMAEDISTLTNNLMNMTDNFYRNWLRALQAVDEMLLNITNTLEWREFSTT